MLRETPPYSRDTNPYENRLRWRLVCEPETVAGIRTNRVAMFLAYDVEGRVMKHHLASVPPQTARHFAALLELTARDVEPAE